MKSEAMLVAEEKLYLSLHDVDLFLSIKEQ